MGYEEALTASEEELKGVFEEAWRISRRNLGFDITFYAPDVIDYRTKYFSSGQQGRFPGISVTGGICALGCDHCRGWILNYMTPAKTPEALREKLVKLKEGGGLGFLLSGGSLSNGSVPLDKYLGVARWGREELGLRYVVHSGIIDDVTAEALARSGVDAVLMDVVGDEETLREICHLNRGVEDIRRALALLRRRGVKTVPHVLVGLHHGEIRGELEALKIIAENEPAAVVVIALMPLPGTPMEGISPPKPMDVARIVLAARLLMPHKPILLGCARPRGRHKVETDKLAIDAGVQGIAYPSDEGVDHAAERGLKPTFQNLCCALIASPE